MEVFVLKIGNKYFKKENDNWELLINLVEMERDGEGVENLELIFANTLINTFNNEFIDALANILLISNKRR